MPTTIECYLCDHSIPTSDGGVFGFGKDCDELREHYITKHNPEKKLYCIRCMGNEELFDAPSLDHMKKHKSEITGFYGKKKSTIVNGKNATRYICRECEAANLPLVMMTSEELVVHLWNEHNTALSRIQNQDVKNNPTEADCGDWDYRMRPIYHHEWEPVNTGIPGLDAILNGGKQKP